MLHFKKYCTNPDHFSTSKVFFVVDKDSPTAFSVGIFITTFVKYMRKRLRTTEKYTNPFPVEDKRKHYFKILMKMSNYKPTFVMLIGFKIWSGWGSPTSEIFF